MPCKIAREIGEIASDFTRLVNSASLHVKSKRFYIGIPRTTDPTDLVVQSVTLHDVILC